MNVEKQRDISDFVKDFNPIHFYRTLRKVGFPKEDAKAMTRCYNQYVYDNVIHIFDYRYKGR